MKTPRDFLFYSHRMEYKEIRNKSGKVLVFCNFEELLTDFYGVKDMNQVEPHVNNQGEYVIHCPFCKKEGHRKHKLYIKSDLSIGHCYVCDRVYINVTDEVDVSYRIPSGISSWLPTDSGFKLIKLEHEYWSLDRFKYEFDDYDERGYNYLVSRHPFMAELYKILDFKFVDGNIAMPFKYHGEIFYYQIRFSGKSDIRYYFPPLPGGGKPPYIIEHGDNKNFIVCEGVFDAIACLIMAPDYTPMAVLVSSISDYQIEFLREYVPDKIIVYMDDTEKSIGVASKLKTIVDYCPISIIKSGGEDPEECMVRRMKTGKELQWITKDYGTHLG